MNGSGDHLLSLSQHYDGLHLARNLTRPLRMRRSEPTQSTKHLRSPWFPFLTPWRRLTGSSMRCGGVEGDGKANVWMINFRFSPAVCPLVFFTLLPSGSSSTFFHSSGARPPYTTLGHIHDGTPTRSFRSLGMTGGVQ